MKIKTDVSLTYTAVVWIFLFLAAFGAITAGLGLNGSTAFNLKVGTSEVGTTNVGIAILVIAAIVVVYLLTRSPKGVRVLMQPKTFVHNATKILLQK